MKSKPEKILSKVPALILNQVEPEHAGEYLCVATNSEGRSEDGLQINVFCEFNFEVSKVSQCFIQINQEPSSLVKVHHASHTAQ